MQTVQNQKPKPMSDEDIQEMLMDNGQWREAWISQRVIDDVRRMDRIPRK
jgi:hypothetical protein